MQIARLIVFQTFSVTGQKYEAKGLDGSSEERRYFRCSSNIQVEAAVFVCFTVFPYKTVNYSTGFLQSASAIINYPSAPW